MSTKVRKDALTGSIQIEKLEAPKKKKKASQRGYSGKSQARHVYITEHKKIRKTKIPTINAQVEELDLHEQLEKARSSSDPLAWKDEAQALLKLGHLARYTGHKEAAIDLMEQAAKVCRYHTLTKTINEV